ncbi:MAG: sugar nucleotide-binding protein, partial [Phycisphaerales bacterium]
MNDPAKQTILVLGASGLLGNAVLRVLAQSPALRVVGTLRSDAVKSRLHSVTDATLILPVDASRFSDLQKIMDEVRPNVLVNCVGATKHIDAGNDPSIAYLYNAILPHSLAALTANAGCRLIHISTDCVFKGNKGMYRESDPTDATDVYGQSKAAGEVHYRNSITVRTS